MKYYVDAFKKYSDIKGCELTIQWDGVSRMYTYIGDTCSFSMSSTNTHVIHYENFSRAGERLISDSVVKTWGEYVDADGYLYARFNPNAAGDVTLIATPMFEPVSPCVLASTLLEPKAELVLNLDKAFDIYRIDYQAWLASGVKLVWTGASPLHTFVAKDCEFAVAIYHKDVVNYTEVPAEGNVILSKDILATLGQYVDEDGYLYIRFLTELEGALTTQLAE